jgi:hypothetical protein
MPFFVAVVRLLLKGNEADNEDCNENEESPNVCLKGESISPNDLVSK